MHRAREQRQLILRAVGRSPRGDAVVQHEVTRAFLLWLLVEYLDLRNTLYPAELPILFPFHLISGIFLVTDNVVVWFDGTGWSKLQGAA